MEIKFLVAKWDDIHNYLAPAEQERLQSLMEKIRAGRVQDGKTPSNQYVVVNLDEPYIDDITSVMQKHGHWSQNA